MKKKFKQLFMNCLTSVINQIEENRNKPKYGISGTSVYVDHEVVLAKAKEDQIKLRAIFNETKVKS